MFPQRLQEEEEEEEEEGEEEEEEVSRLLNLLFLILVSLSWPAGLFCRLQVAGCWLKFHYNWKYADTKKKHISVRLTVTDT